MRSSRSPASARTALNFVDRRRRSGARAILFEPPAPADTPAPADAIAVPGLRARLGELADRFHGHPSRAMTVVGVTGTNGKTSTVQLLAQAWTLLGTRAAPSARSAPACTAVVPTGFTTPLVLQLHQLLARAARRRARRRWRWKSARTRSTRAASRRAFRCGGVHQPHARPSRLPRRHGAPTARPRRAVRRGRAARGGDQPRRRLRPRAVRRRCPPACAASAERARRAGRVRAETWRSTPPASASTSSSRTARHRALAAARPLQCRQPARGRRHAARARRRAGASPPTLSQLQPIHGRMNRLGGKAARRWWWSTTRTRPTRSNRRCPRCARMRPGAPACVFGCGGDATAASARRWRRSPSASPTA
jgi:UDP-N-acetylmuramoyl-L-alanyl-D-glutamate--2,6-diaminopimelate ligase